MANDPATTSQQNPKENLNILACPARFERATYALEEIVAAGMFIYFNDLHIKTGTV